LKKSVTLETGILEIVTLWNGQLVLAELIGSKTPHAEISRVLRENGIIFGQLEENISKLANGYNGQIPVARADVYNAPGAPWFHFEESINTKIFNKWLQEGSVGEIDLTYRVEKDERLVTLSAPPKLVLKYPSGRVKVLQELDIESIHYYAGENISRGMHKQSLVAEIDGYAHRNLYGVVSVHPMKEINKIGKMHGEMNIDNALRVKEDVQHGSVIDVGSNLHVQGIIRSSRIKVKGNLQCEYGIEGSEDEKLPEIYVGQSLLSSGISRYRIWTGINLISKTSINRSEIECMDSVFTGNVVDSFMKVGNRLYVYGDIKNSTIYLGYSFVIDPEIKYQKQLFVQKRKGLEDLLQALTHQKNELDRKRKLTIEHLNKLKNSQFEGFNADALLNMQFRAMKTSLQQLEAKVRDFQEELDLYRKLSMVMSVDETNPYVRYEPEIVVKGKISDDVKIYGPNGPYNFDQELENVVLKLDKSSGTFEALPLKLN